MLKAILFVLFIIITFDIGKSLIDAKRKEQKLEAETRLIEEVKEAEINEQEIQESDSEVHLLLEVEVPKNSEDEFDTESLETPETENNFEQLTLPELQDSSRLDLSIPADIVHDQDEGGTSTSVHQSSAGAKQSKADTKYGKPQLTGKPILKKEEEMLKPEVTGVSVGVKVEM